MSRTLLAWILLLGALTTGCLGGDQASQAQDQVPQEARSEGLTFENATLVTDACGNCFEPTVAVDDQGRIFVTYAGGPLLVSTDGGRTFTEEPVPPLPPGVPPTAYIGDETVDVGPQGRLFFSALVGSASGGSEGIQVARSDDGGQSWTVNTLVSPAPAPTPGSVFADRQWVGFGAEDRVYVSYWQYVPRSGAWMATSTDGGASFSQPVLVASTAERGGRAGAPGIPVETSSGRVVLPIMSFSTDLPRRGLVQVALSDDQGQSFETIEVHTLEEGYAYRPLAAETADGQLHLAWTVNEGSTFVASSQDDGETWTKPGMWDTGDHAPLQPWLHSRGDEVQVAWFHEQGDDWHLRLAQGTPGQASEVQRATLAEELPAAQQGGGFGGNHAGTTDFPHFDLDPDGRAVITWSDGEAIVIAQQELGVGELG